MRNDILTTLNPARANEARVTFTDVDDQKTRMIPSLQPEQMASTPRVTRDDTVERAAVAKNEAAGNHASKPKKKRRFRKWLLIPLGLLLLLAGVFIYMVVSSPSEVAVPDVADMTQAEAKKALIEKKLVPKVEKISDDTVEKGMAVRTDPTAETKVRQGRTVKLFISQGQVVTLSDYTGMSYTDAKNELLKLGVAEENIVKKTEKVTDGEDGKVLRQSPKSGKKIDLSSAKVTLTVSEAQSVKLDNLIGMSESQASAYLGKHGLVPNVVNQYSNSPQDTVFATAPDAGTQVRAGETVTIYISLGAEPAPSTEPEPSSSSSSSSSSTQQTETSNSSTASSGTSSSETTPSEAGNQQ
jgi:serine/threonine-protein kinase